MIDNKTNIYKKILNAKKDINAITKDSKNPFFKSMYFDINKILSEVEPVLQENGLLLLQPIEAEWVKSIIYDVDTKESVSSEIQLPSIIDPQKLGSAITYYRRYTLQSLLGLQAEDDDANSLSLKPKKQTLPIRKKALTDSQFKATKKAKVEQIKVVLDKFRMSDVQRKELESLIK